MFSLRGFRRPLAVLLHTIWLTIIQKLLDALVKHWAVEFQNRKHDCSQNRL
jgi:hypothetical protein